MDTVDMETSALSRNRGWEIRPGHVLPSPTYTLGLDFVLGHHNRSGVYWGRLAEKFELCNSVVYEAPPAATQVLDCTTLCQMYRLGRSN